MPAFRASLERGGRFLSPSHAHDSWAWVDDAFPDAVAALASAADDVSRRADALETFLVSGARDARDARDATVANERKTGKGILARRGTSRVARRDDAADDATIATIAARFRDRAEPDGLERAPPSGSTARRLDVARVDLNRRGEI